jgi:hypothetical protein
VRLVIATTKEDPLHEVFWTAYRQSGGPPPDAVVFLRPRRRPAPARRALEGVLLFGLRDAWRWWRLARRVRRAVAHAPAALFAGAHRFHEPGSLNGPEGARVLAEEAPDLLVSVGAPEVFRAPVLRAARWGAVNVHHGRLPAYRGLFGTFWELSRGESWGYTTLHLMVPRVDAGPVLAHYPVAMSGRSLLDVLVRKRQVGGRLLAWLAAYAAREGRLPPPMPGEPGAVDGYGGWPTMRDLVRFRLRRAVAARARPAPPDRLAPPAAGWPQDLV